MRKSVARTASEQAAAPPTACLNVAPDTAHKRRSRSRLITTFLTAVACSATLGVPALADDIDVYTARLAAQKKPNILFVLDFSGSMNEDINNEDASVTGEPRKIDVLRTAMDNVLANNVGVIRAGIGSIYSTEASGVRWPVTDLDIDAHEVDSAIPAGAFTAREIMNKQLERQNAGGWTSTVNALAEAALYFRGETISNGSRNRRGRPNPDTWSSIQNQYLGGNVNAAIEASYTSTPGASNTHNYVSPIEGQCNASVIVLISDGLPTRRNDTQALRTALGDDPATCEDVSSSIFGNNWLDDGNCGPEIVNQLASMPQVPGISDSTVNTYTVGFGLEGVGKDYLDRLAYEGSPVRDGTRLRDSAFSARNLTELNAALAEIVRLAAGSNQSFSELSVDIDKASFSHDDRAYFSLFSPAPTRGWKGNLKGYFLDSRGLVDTNNTVALEAGGSAFSSAAQSFWSATPDGNDPLAGGASARLTADNRSLYTYDDALDPFGSGVDLSSSNAYRLHADNALVTAADLGVNVAERAATLEWIQSAPMGDPLHSKSLSVSYGSRQVVYVMTNQGLLHAIDATSPTSPTAGDHSGGGEIFAFMPKRLLSNLPTLARGENGPDHIYGLDGAMTPWHTDANNDGIVNGQDRLLLIFGMRRGGDAYYAMDVTDPEQPILKWIIDSSRAGFADLAQSWSRMSLINVQRSGGEEQVLLFGGGYDAAANDDANTHVPARGNALFMVDRAGNLVRRIDDSSHSDMRYSIPADLTPVDVDGDGLTDRIYAADLGAQLWRIDIDNVDSAADTTVTRLANLAGGGFQPFFGAPSVALNNSATGEFLSIAVGSGNRTDPLDDDSDNAFFMLRDEDVAKGAPANPFTTITSARLYDATDNLLASTDATLRRSAYDALEQARGWRIDLDAGEKSLTRLVSYQGHLYATTFAPSGTSSDPCAVPSTSYLYRMDIRTGIPYGSGTETSESLETSTRRVRLDTTGIPSPPSVIFTKGSSVAQVFVDRKAIEEIPQELTRIYWYGR